tara:strand:- start:795 stop:1757 length:963 start_codon:yes stop_codon:yes gene_type:complete
MPDHTFLSIKGNMGEHYVQFLLGRMDIDAVKIDRTYDLFLWKNMHRVEVKTSRTNESGPKRKHDGKKEKRYDFKFIGTQIQKNAFDYAICVGYDIDYNPKDIFVIPQSYIYEQAKSEDNLDNNSMIISIPIERPIAQRYEGIFKTCNNYDKFRMCVDNLDVFKQTNKSAFTRKKNQLTKKLLNYQEDCLKNMKEEFLRIYNDKNIHNPSQVVEDKFGIKTNVRWQWAKELGLGNQISVSWKKKWGYEDEKITPMILKLWRKGYTRTEISKELTISFRRTKRICDGLTLPKKNPYRPKRVPWNKGKHTGNQYTRKRKGGDK